MHPCRDIALHRDKVLNFACSSLTGDIPTQVIRLAALAVIDRTALKKSTFLQTAPQTQQHAFIRLRPLQDTGERPINSSLG